MNLNGKQIVDHGIITKVDNPECVQQIGVDLEIIAIHQIVGHGIIPKEGKTKLPDYRPVEMVSCPNSNDNGTTRGWFLLPGAYDITLKQGCKIPATQRLQIVQRSSLLRNGGLLASSMFDPGFETENIGTVMHIFAPIYIHYEARVAQAYVTRVNEVLEDSLYKGQWQGDQQRKQDDSPGVML